MYPDGITRREDRPKAHTGIVDKDASSPQRQEVPRAPHSTCALVNNSLSESRLTSAPGVPGDRRFPPGRPPERNLAQLRRERPKIDVPPTQDNDQKNDAASQNAHPLE